LGGGGEEGMNGVVEIWGGGEELVERKEERKEVILGKGISLSAILGMNAVCLAMAGSRQLLHIQKFKTSALNCSRQSFHHPALAAKVAGSRISPLR
jgi:hypothetical protein